MEPDSLGLTKASNFPAPLKNRLGKTLRLVHKKRQTNALSPPIELFLDCCREDPFRLSTVRQAVVLLPWPGINVLLNPDEFAGAVVEVVGYPRHYTYPVQG